MKLNCIFPARSAALLLMAALAMSIARAYPPALPHTFYGMIRDELGNPLAPGAAITLETTAGVKVYSAVSTLQEAGVNYRLNVPLDAGLTSELYKPTALQPAVPFKIKVKIGNVTYLPIEMTHSFAHIGQPGKSTLLNLTLGEDSNGDGLPDAWQRRISQDLANVTPDGDADKDGLSNLDEYLAGTYAFDPESGFLLQIVRLNSDAPVLAFTAITGRTYTLFGSSGLNSNSWAPVAFRPTTAAVNDPALTSYSADGVAAVEVVVVTPQGGEIPKFFKLMLQ